MQSCEKTVAIPQLQFVFFPGQGRSQLVVVQRQSRLVQTSKIVQVRSLYVVDASVMRVLTGAAGAVPGSCRDVGLRQH